MLCICHSEHRTVVNIKVNWIIFSFLNELEFPSFEISLPICWQSSKNEWCIPWSTILACGLKKKSCPDWALKTTYLQKWIALKDDNTCSSRFSSFRSLNVGTSTFNCCTSSSSDCGTQNRTKNIKISQKSSYLWSFNVSEYWKL